MIRLGGEILGPLPSSEVVEKMFTGEVDESTQISLGEDGAWRTIQVTTEFHPFLYRAKAKIRAERARAEAERAARRRHTRNVIKVALGALALVIVSFVASYMLIVNRPWQNRQALRAWAEKHVPLLVVKSASAAIVGATGVGPEKQEEEEEEEEDVGGINIDQILIDDAPALVAIQGTGERKSTGGKKKDRFGGKKEKKTETKTASLSSLSNDEITAVVYARSNLNKLYACIRQELQRSPDMPRSFTLDFSITNDGRVGQVLMEDPRLDGSSLHQCFRQKLARLRFQSYSGQVRNVTIPFNVGK